MGKKRVLVVDDHQMMREIISEIIQNLGYETFVAEDGERAIITLQCEKADGVVTDFQMPKVNGKNLTRWVKHNLPEIPVIMVTGDDPETIFSPNDSSNDIPDIIFKKPFSVAVLSAVITTLIGPPEKKEGEV